MRFLLIDYESAIFVMSVSITDSLIIPRLWVLKCFSQPPFDIFAFGIAFFLCSSADYRQKKLRTFIEGMDSLYFKINVDLPPSQHPYSFQRIYSITGKTVCRFCKDRIDLSPPASRYHRIKSTASLRLCPASNVGINTGECPMRNSLNPFLIVLFL